MSSLDPSLDRAPLSRDALLDRFLAFASDAGVELYPAQEEAILELWADKNVILSTPTGSGKSLVATAGCYLALAEGRRAFYTCPIKALVSEKFFALSRDLGAANVGMMTGDASVNRDAPIICCTAEVLASIALREGFRADVDFVVMDEFHYYADPERGVAWQIPLLTLRQASFLLMSATLGDTTFFERVLTEHNGKPTALVRSTTRPVPLTFEYRETPLHETLDKLVKTGRAPVYLVNFTQRSAAEEAQNLMSVDLSTKEEKKRINEELRDFRFASPFGKELSRYVRHGIGLHHAGLLPRYRLLVEKLAQKGMLKVISGTDTLGVGVNVPIRTVLFTKLCKYDGQKTAILSVRDFQQISGRAGRRGFDDLGTVIAQAPEHVIENLRLEAKAGDDPKKKRKIVRKKPPDKGYVHWDRATFDRLVTSPPEPLASRFRVSHAMLLSVLGRDDGGCRAMKDLIRTCHDRPAERRIHGRQAKQMLRALWEAGIIELTSFREDPRGIRVHEELGREFTMNQALSLYLVDTVERLDRDAETYAMDVVTLAEAILESPDAVLYRQVDKLKRDKMAELKAKGVEFDQRIEELEKIEHPKPLRDFVYDTWNLFAKKHPWVGDDNIRPKSIAREICETRMSFAEYVKEYALERSEGVLLRYLSDAYKTLAQTVPPLARNDELVDATLWLGALVRGVDGSLLEEWEKMRSAAPAEAVSNDVLLPDDVTRDVRAFTVLVRNELFSLVRALARRDYAAASDLLAESEDAWPPERLEAALRPYFAEHQAIRVDPLARAPVATRVKPSPDGAVWRVEQTLFDPEEDDDWVVEVAIDLARARAAARPLMTLVRIER